MVDIMESVNKIAQDDDFLSLDINTQVLYFHLVARHGSREDGYTDSFSNVDGVYDIAREIGLYDDDTRESLDRLFNTGFLAIHVNYNRCS